MFRASLLLSSLLHSSDAESKGSCNVVVVGAGIAGLSAGQTLRRLNCSVTLLEARDEIGGRTKTVTSGPFAGVELGAHWVHGGLENEISAPLLSYLGIPIVPIGGDDDFEGRRKDFDIYHGSHRMNKTERKRVFHFYNKVADALDDWLDSKMDSHCDGADECRATDIDIERGWEKALKSLDKVEPPATKLELEAVDLLKRIAYEQDFGDVLSKISGRVGELNSYTSFYPKGGHGDAFIEGGYTSLVRALAVGLDVHVSTPVISINHSDQGVTVTTAKGNFSGDHVIVTTSAPVFHKINFQPALPDWKSAAVSRIGAGQVAKGLVLLKEPLPVEKSSKELYTFARVGAEDDIISMCVRSAAEHPRLSNFNFNRTLECFIGAGALNKTMAMSTEERIQAVETQLQESFSSVTVEQVEITPWAQDEYIGLAWSYPPVGTVKQDFLDYAQAVERVHFAGEASCFLMWGNVHAALASSSRAVMEILSEKQKEAAAASDWPLLKESVYKSCEHHTSRTAVGHYGPPRNEASNLVLI